MASSSRHSRVLVVEDDEELREGLRRLLEDEGGYEVLVAEDGQSGLRILSEQPCSLVLLDLMMPVMNGWQFREQQLRQPHLASIPVVIISAADVLRQVATSLQVAGFLRKPFKVDELLFLTRQLCEGQPEAEAH